MRRMEQIRTAIAVLLLSVVLPMTLLLPFHHHEEEESATDACELCTSHRPHPGHLASAGQVDKCLICQFLGVSYLPESCVSAPSAPCCNAVYAGLPAPSFHLVPTQLLSTRAPPCSFC